LADDPEPVSAPERWVAVCTEDRLAEKKMVCTRVLGEAVIIILEGDQVHACERACPHEQADLSFGRVNDGKLYCPRHLAWFDLGNGAISPGWSSRPLRRYPVQRHGGHIWLHTSAATVR
jgi:3-phenylpropionate/trans-cinnamate dioxygenase ferredoxin subunit